MLFVALLAAGLSSDVAGPDFEDFVAEADRLVLSGRPMPAAFLLDVKRLPEASDRMRALVYLRRSGLLTGPALSLDDIVFQTDAGPGRVQTEPAKAPKDED